MKKINIPAKTKNKSSTNVRLIDILMVIRADIISDQWICHDIAGAGPETEQLHKAGSNEEILSTADLMIACTKIKQFSAGKFSCMAHGTAEPWLVIEVKTAGEFVIGSSNEQVLAKLTNRFEHPDKPSIAAGSKKPLQRERIKRTDFKPGMLVKFGWLADGDKFKDETGALLKKFPFDVLPGKLATNAVNDDIPDKRYHFAYDQEVEFVEKGDGPFPYFAYDTVR